MFDGLAVCTYVKSLSPFLPCLTKKKGHFIFVFGITVLGYIRVVLTHCKSNRISSNL